MLQRTDAELFDIQIGDTCRFPLSTADFGRYNPFSDEPRGVYNQTWEVIAFGGQGFRHCAYVRRLHNGLIKLVSLYWIDLYQNPYLWHGRNGYWQHLKKLRDRSPDVYHECVRKLKQERKNGLQATTPSA